MNIESRLELNANFYSPRQFWAVESVSLRENVLLRECYLCIKQKFVQLIISQYEVAFPCLIRLQVFKIAASNKNRSNLGLKNTLDNQSMFAFNIFISSVENYCAL